MVAESEAGTNPNKPALTIFGGADYCARGRLDLPPSRTMMTRFRPRLESLDARIVPDGGMLADPGGDGPPAGGQQPPAPPQPPQVPLQSLLDAYTQTRETYIALIAQYDRYVDRAVVAETESQWYQQAANKTLARLFQLGTAGDPLLQAALQVQVTTYTNAANTKNADARRLHQTADFTFVQQGNLGRELVRLSDQIRERTGKTPAELGLGSIPPPSQYDSWNVVYSRAADNVRNGTGRPADLP